MNEQATQFLKRLADELMREAEEETKRGEKLHADGLDTTASEATAITLGRIAIAIERAII